MLRIIAKLWSVIYDLLFYIDGTGNKTLDQIHSDLNIIEMLCRPLAGIDDVEDKPKWEEVDGDMDDTISREEHNEFVRRIEAEDKRQNERIRLLEETTKQIGALTTSVEKLAQSIQGMVKEQAQQGKRLEVLEARDGEMWRKVTSHVITAIISILIGYVFSRIGM